MNSASPNEFASTETTRAVTLPSIDERAGSPQGRGRDGNKPLMRNRAAIWWPSPTGRIDGNLSHDTHAKERGKAPARAAELQRRAASGERGLVPCVTAGRDRHHFPESGARVGIPAKALPAETDNGTTECGGDVCAGDSCPVPGNRIKARPVVTLFTLAAAMPARPDGPRDLRRLPAFFLSSARLGGGGARPRWGAPAARSLRAQEREGFGSGGVLCPDCRRAYPAVLLACPHCETSIPRDAHPGAALLLT